MEATGKRIHLGSLIWYVELKFILYVLQVLSRTHSFNILDYSTVGPKFDTGIYIGIDNMLYHRKVKGIEPVTICMQNEYSTVL